MSASVNSPSRPPLDSQTTPPLEFREAAEPPASGWRSAASALIGALIGAGLALGVAAVVGVLQGAPHAHPTFTTFDRGRIVAAVLAELIGVWLGVVLMHELAHGLAGRLVGLQLTRLTVGPLRLSRGARGWELGLTRGPHRFRGSVVVAPSKWTGAQDMRRAWSRMVVAGPGINLVCALVLLGSLPALRERSQPSGIVSLLATAILLSLVGGVLSLVPSNSWAGGVSDGEQLRRLRHREPNGDGPGETFSAVVMLGASAQVLRPREWNADAVAIARRGSTDVPTAVAAHGLLYHHTLDCGDVAGARTHLQRVLDLAANDSAPRGVLRSGFARLRARGRADLAVAAATFEAAWRGDVTAAHAWLARATQRSRGALGAYGLEVAHAAVAWASGDPAARDAALAKAESIVATGEFPSLALLHAATLERISGRSV